MDSPYSPLEYRLLNDWQRDFPLVPQPFRQLGALAGSEESAVLTTLLRLQQRGAISRVGAVLAPRRVGVSTLAALAAPAERIEEIAAQVNARAEVNHNYLREHAWNLWFVATGSNAAALAGTLAAIEADTGCPVLSLPLEREYHIDLGFDLQTPGKACRPGPLAAPETVLDAADKRLLAALQPGLELVPRPYLRLAEQAGMPESEVLARLAAWVANGLIKRFGVVVRHHELGFRANAMVVFDLPDEAVDRLGEQLARDPGVTLCYRRRRAAPHWPYNLYCMVHGRSREEVQPVVERLGAAVGQAGVPLFSTRRFKQCGARYFADV